MISSVPSGVGRDPTAALAALEVAPQPLAAAQPRASASRGAAVLAAAASALTPAGKKPARPTSKKRSATGYASSAKKTSSSKAKPTTAKAGGALAFLDDPRLSTEEKLFRFMMYVTEKYDRDIEQKMKAAGGGGTSSGGSSAAGTKKKSSNPFSKIAGALKTVFPAAGIALEALNNKNLQSLVKSISGPALAAGAAALGMPALAPSWPRWGRSWRASPSTSPRRSTSPPPRRARPAERPPEAARRRARAEIPRSIAAR